MEAPKVHSPPIPHPRQEQQLTRPILFRPTLETDRNSLRLMKAVAKWHDRSLLNFPRVWKYKKKRRKSLERINEPLGAIPECLETGLNTPRQTLETDSNRNGKKGYKPVVQKMGQSFPSNSRRNENSNKKKDKQKFKTFLAVILTSHLSCFSFLGIFRQTKGKCCKRISKKKRE